QRPAPSGLFMTLGDLTANAPALLELGALSRADVTAWHLDDSIGPHTGPIAFPGAGTVFFEGGASAPVSPQGGTLLQIREHLRRLGSEISAALPKGEKWLPAMQGF